MKKILITLGIIALGVLPAGAATIKVESLSDFTTENPPETLTVKAVTDLELDDEIYIFAGYQLKGNIVDVSSPKRLKRDATFSFVLTEYTDNQGVKHQINSDTKLFKGKFTTKFDYKGVAKSAALGVGSYFIKGLSMGYAAIEGAVKNEEGNRLKSSAVSLYESTPLSYVEKGQDIIISKNQVFFLNFKLKNEEENEEPNYEYTELSDEQIKDVSQEAKKEQNINNDSNEKNIKDSKKNSEKILKKGKNKEEASEGVEAVLEKKKIETKNEGVKVEEQSNQNIKDTENKEKNSGTENIMEEIPTNQSKEPLAPLELPDTY